MVVELSKKADLSILVDGSNSLINIAILNANNNVIATHTINKNEEIFGKICELGKTFVNNGADGYRYENEEVVCSLIDALLEAMKDELPEDVSIELIAELSYNVSTCSVNPRR